MLPGKLLCAAAKMQIFRTIALAIVATSGYIKYAQACITATTDLDGRDKPTVNATRTTNVYLTGDCIDGKLQEEHSSAEGSSYAKL